MNYIEYVNRELVARLRTTRRYVAFGQNVAAGGRITGLTRGFDEVEGLTFLNTPNCENALVGMGFGLMASGVDCGFYCKQQDFLLLAIDPMVNTYNMLRLTEMAASFTIVAIVVDSGFEGPQSRLDNLGDFCSLARVPGYTISNASDARLVTERHLVAPGFRLLGISQRLLRREVLDPGPVVEVYGDADVLCYQRGRDVTIACFNFSFPEGQRLAQRLAQEGRTASLFSVNAGHATSRELEPVVEDTARTRRLVVLDDSRSLHRSSLQLEVAVARSGSGACVHTYARDPRETILAPNADVFDPVDEALSRLREQLTLAATGT